MTLTPEQKQAVSDWIAAGDNLSVVQQKLTAQFKISMTYRDVRFLVDDLGLELKNAAPKTDANDVTKTRPRPLEAGASTPRARTAGPDDGLPPEEYPEDEGVPAQPAPAGASTLTLEIDRLMRPGTMVSGSVIFSDGVSGKWALDQQGRLMLETPQKGYQPTPVDVQAFQRELQVQLQRQGY
ncbi:MAG: hypothetical protein WDM96_05625 [Lacunisphaera sp.]